MTLEVAVSTSKIMLTPGYFHTHVFALPAFAPSNFSNKFKEFKENSCTAAMSSANVMDILMQASS